MNNQQMIKRHEQEMARKTKQQEQAAVEVFSRQMINNGMGQGGVLISILQSRLIRIDLPDQGEVDHRNTHPVDTKFWRKVLSLRFDDTAPGEFGGWRCFEEQQADQIWEFVKDVEQDETINIHCAAGVSRSVAVGAVIADVFERSLIVHSGVGIQFANPHVSALMRREIWQNKLRRVP